MRRAGFSLFEVLLAIGLIVLMFGAMFGFFWDMLSTRERIMEITHQRRAAATLVERLERDLATCVAGDGIVGAGVAGDGTTLRVLCRSVPVRLAGSGASATASFMDLERSEYRFEPAGGAISASRTVVAPGARGRAAPVDDGPFGGTIYRVRFRYHDGRAWRDEFDSLVAGHLPRAVEIAVWFEPWAGAEVFDEEILADDDDRLTFDAGGAFDESEFAERSDLEDFDEPAPDRIRVIIVPDADPESDEAEDDGSSGGAP